MTGDESGLLLNLALVNTTQDIQSRLVFKAQAYIRTELESFQPKPEDLDYPKRLQTLKVPATADGTTLLPQPDTATPAFDSALVDSGTVPVKSAHIAYQNWFPTLPRTLYLLSRLYKCVNVSVNLFISYHNIV